MLKPMKRITRIPLLVAIVAMALPATFLPLSPFSPMPLFAQGPNGDAPRQKRPPLENGQTPERRGPGARAPGGFRGDRGERRPEGFKPDWDRYLNGLKERNPEEAERLSKLKEGGDIDAFNAEIRKHFENRAGPRMGKGHNGMSGKGGMGGMSMFRKPNPKLDEIRGRLRTALKAQHENPSADNKATLRAVIAEEFDEGCADHQRHIDKMEEALLRMKTHIDEQRTNRDDHIDSRLERALKLQLKFGSGGPGPRPDGPRKK